MPEVYEAWEVTELGLGQKLYAFPTGLNPTGPVKMEQLPEGLYKLTRKDSKTHAIHKAEPGVIVAYLVK